MGKYLRMVFQNETISLSECSDGFWLYDKTRGMNLAMRAKSSTYAFVESLMYYQKRLTDVEKKHQNMEDKVNKFVSQFTEEE